MKSRPAAPASPPSPSKASSSSAGGGRKSSSSEAFVPLYKRAMLRSSHAFTKDELMDVIFWFRSAVAFVVGVIWGVVPLQGAVPMVLAIMLIGGVVFAWHKFYLSGINEDDMGGRSKLLQEGFFPAYTLFVLTWIIVYTIFNFDHE